MKEDLNNLCKEYQQVLNMTDEEVMREYDDLKSNVLADYEREIDWYESKLYNL